MELEKRQLREEMARVVAECKGLREENVQLKNVKMTLEKRLELLDSELEQAVSERIDIKDEFS